MTDFSSNDDVPRRRVDPFTEEEDEVMLTAIIERRHVIDHRFSNGARISNAEKMAAWKEVTALVNAKGEQFRDVSKIKVRYDNLAQVYRRYKLRKSDRKPSCYELLDWFNAQAKIEGGALGASHSPNTSRSGSPGDSTLYEDRGIGENDYYHTLQSTISSDAKRLQNMNSYVEKLLSQTPSEEQQLAETNSRIKNDTWIKQEDADPHGEEENIVFEVPCEITNGNICGTGDITLNRTNFGVNDEDDMDSRDEPTPAEAAISAGIKRTQKSRAAIVALYESGVRRAEIANLLRVNKVLVWRTIKRFEMQKSGARSAGQDRAVRMARRVIDNAIPTIMTQTSSHANERTSILKARTPATNSTQLYSENGLSTLSNEISSNYHRVQPTYENDRSVNPGQTTSAVQSRATGLVNVGVSGVNEAALQKYIREVVSQENNKSRILVSPKDRAEDENKNNCIGSRNLDMIENEFEDEMEDGSNVQTDSRLKRLQIQVLEARLTLLRQQIRNAQTERLNLDEKRENVRMERELLRDQQRNTRKRDNAVGGNGSLQFQ